VAHNGATRANILRGVTKRTWLMLAGGAVTLVLLVAIGIAIVVTRRPKGITAGPSGHTTMIVVADSGDRATLDRTAKLLAARLQAAGEGDVSTEVQGDRRIRIRVAGTDEAEQLRALLVPGILSFRRVLGTFSSTASSAAPAPTGAAPTLDQVIAKVGRPAYDAATGLTDPSTVPPDQAALLAPFGTLSPAEVAVLPPALQYAIPVITCAQLDQRPTGTPTPDRYTACDRTSPATKYLMDVPALGNADIARAAGSFDPNGNGWMVTIGFTADGQQRWSGLTRAVVDGPLPTKQAAIVLDDTVTSAPTIEAVITGDAQISGSLSRDQALNLAGRLAAGPLPVPLHMESVVTQR
jgi:preprotein translocase subunit SecD